uniref:Mos1 transposase HTH domain-containing protein n=1 Tax=Eptatretus burgeri TaxID=7764 RepID=A0A8C4R0B7_EPTBU
MACRATSHEQRANLKFLAKLRKTPSESFAILHQAYGEETMSHAHEWRKRFKEGREKVEDDPRSGRPSTSRTAENIERVKQMVCADCRLTVRMIAEELSINKDTVWSIITENPEMRKLCAKMVPKLLSSEQKQQRVTLCQDIFDRIKDDSDPLRRVITEQRLGAPPRQRPCSQCPMHPTASGGEGTCQVWTTPVFATLIPL